MMWGWMRLMSEPVKGEITHGKFFFAERKRNGYGWLMIIKKMVRRRRHLSILNSTVEIGRSATMFLLKPPKILMGREKTK